MVMEYIFFLLLYFFYIYYYKKCIYANFGVKVEMYAYTKSHVGVVPRICDLYHHGIAKGGKRQANYIHYMGQVVLYNTTLWKFVLTKSMFSQT